MDRAAKIRPYEFFGTYDLSLLWRVSQRTIRRWIAEGSLRAHRKGPRGGRYFVLGQEVQRFIYEELSDGED